MHANRAGSLDARDACISRVGAPSAGGRRPRQRPWGISGDEDRPRITQCAQQSIDLYELTIGRHRSSSFVITSNRAVEEWLGLFDDPILGNSALDRLANASYKIVIEGESYRQRLSPHRALLEAQEGAD